MLSISMRIGVFVLVLSMQLYQVAAQTYNFDIVDGGAVVFDSPNELAQPLQAGYARLDYSGSGGSPSGFGILSLRQTSSLSSEIFVLNSESLITATDLLTEGLVYAVSGDNISTILGFVNPNATPVSVSFRFDGNDGVSLGNGSFEIGPNQQFTTLTTNDPFNGPVVMEGTLALDSSNPIAISAFQILTNENAETLVTTIPVKPLSLNSYEAIFLPLLLVGDGGDKFEIASTVVLTNTSNSTITGELQIEHMDSSFFTYPTLNYTIQPGGVWRTSYSEIPQISASELPPGFQVNNLFAGYARAVPDSGSAEPAGLVLISQHTRAQNSVTNSIVAIQSENGGTEHAVFIDGFDDFSHDETLMYSVFISNASELNNSIEAELTNFEGESIGQVTTYPISANRGVLLTPGELWDLPENFSGGLMRISSIRKVLVAGLRTRTNELGVSKMVEVPHTNQNTPTADGDAYFPLILDGAGLSTEFFIFNKQLGPAGTGALVSYSPSGAPQDFKLTRYYGPGAFVDQLFGSFRILSADGLSNVITTMTFDGAGNGTTSEVLSYSEEEIHTTSSVLLRYVVSQNRILDLLLDPGSDQQTFRGGMSLSGNSFILASSNNEPSLVIAHKESSGLTNLALDGTYVAGATNDESNSLINFSFDGEGDGSFEVTYDLQEGNAAAGEFIPFSYTVSNNGQLRIVVDEGNGEEEFRGIVNSDGSSFNLASVSGKSKLIIVAHKLSGEQSLATLSGSFVAGALFGISSSGFQLSFDGAGEGSIVINDETPGVGSTNYPFTYNIDFEGRVTISLNILDSDEIELQGILNVNGSQLVAVGTTLTEPSLIVAMKAP